MKGFVTKVEYLHRNYVGAKILQKYTEKTVSNLGTA
jgi:hypothetical protein